jgi:hypothetical protein
MGKGNEEADGVKPGKATPSLEELCRAVEQMLRTALRKGRPRGVEWEVVDLYRDTDDSTGRTLAVLGACLSGWESLAPDLEALAGQEGPLSLEDIAALLIHRTHLRKRRRDYRDQQMARQVDRANVRAPDGEILPFDPQAPEERQDFLKNLEELIATLLAERSVRDRMVLDLYLHGHTYAAIVEAVQAALPDERLSQPTVSRIVERFRDELRARLKDK